MRALEKLLIGNSLSSLLVQDVSSLSRLKTAMSKIEGIELLEDAQIIGRTFEPSEKLFPPFGDTRRAIFRYVIRDAVVHLESGLAKVCGGFLIEELIGNHTGVFGGGTAVHEYHTTLKQTQRFKGVWTVMPVPRFYFHFIAETLPTLLRVLEHSQVEGILVSHKMPKWAVEVLTSLDVEVRYIPNVAIEIEFYVCCSAPQISSVSDVVLLREKFSNLLSATGNNLAFIGRGLRQRNLGSLEGEVAKIVTDSGGVSVDPETLGWKEELQFFSKLDRLILVGGSASANVVWMKPGTKVLVLYSHEGFTTQIEKSQYKAAGVEYFEFNTDNLNQMNTELEIYLKSFISE